MGKRLFCYISGFFVFFTLCVLVFFCKNEWWWLFSNSSDLKKLGFDWIFSAWGVSLGIHGTISALSLTFMSVTVDAVNKSSPHALESYIRKKILDEINLVQFGIDAISTLIISFFFFVFGGGIAQYVVSQLLSMYFLLKYFKTYLKLFNMSRNKNFAVEYLQSHCSNLVNGYTSLDDANSELHDKILNLVRDLPSGYYSYGEMKMQKQQPYSIGIYGGDNVLAVGIDLEKLHKLNGFLNEMKVEGLLDEYEIVVPNINLHSSGSKNIEVNYTAKNILDKKASKKISSLIVGVLITDNEFKVISHYDELVNGVVIYLYSTLLENNRESIRNAINVFSCLVNGDVSAYPFDVAFGLSYQYLNDSDVKKNSIDELMNNFSELNVNLRKKTAALEFIIQIAKLSLNRDDFNAFIKNHEDTLNSYLSYHDDNTGYYEVIKGLIESACNELDYSAIMFWGEYFNAGTRHLSVKYLNLEKRNASEIISVIFKIQRFVLTVLQMRWSAIQTDNKSDVEIDAIINASKLWSDLAIFSNYTDEIELYGMLFGSYEERIRVSIDEQRIRNLPEGEAYTVTEYHYAIRALVFILLVLAVKRRGFNLRYLYDWRKLVDVVGFSSNDYHLLIKACKSSELSIMVTSMGYDNNEVKREVDLIKNKFDMMLEYKSKEVTRKVIKSKMDKNIVLRFEIDVNLHLNKWLVSKLNVDLSKLPICHKTSELIFYPSKREFLGVVDDVSYLSSAGLYGDGIISIYKQQLFNCIKAGERFLKFNDADIEKSNYILFVNKNSVKNYNYQDYKEYKLTYFFEDENVLNNIYAVSLDSFTFFRGFDSNDACHIEIKEITKDNYRLYSKAKNLNDDDEIFEKVILKLYPNLKVSFNIDNVIFTE